MRFKDKDYYENLVECAIGLSRLKETKVILKAHPVSDLVDYYKEALSSYGESQVTIVTEPWTTQHFEIADIVINFGFLSGSVLQAIHLGIPTLYFSGFASSEHEACFKNIGPVVETVAECFQRVSSIRTDEHARQVAIAGNLEFLRLNAKRPSNISLFSAIELACERT